ncbi:MAG TPA: hypothetical protein VNG71_09030 [Pyrinomonadaceae bacterium]|nr:hypothetical protein [Pyrinomonadaceae bacterium]
MFKKILTGVAVLSAVAVLIAAAFALRSQGTATANAEPVTAEEIESLAGPAVTDNGFSVEVIIAGRPAMEYAAAGRRYIEALENAEYELRIHNPTGARVAVALAVDGLNSIDARHTSAWDAHKWVIEPYGTIYVRGWQMSSESARRFYFTTERDSYAAKLGQVSNLGLISAVFFRERRPITILPVTPGPRRGEEREKDERSGWPSSGTSNQNAPSSAPSSTGEASRDSAKQRSVSPSYYPPPDDESAATGIGRSVQNGVQWIKMDLDQRPAGEVTIRYEYRSALVRLGIIPRDYPRPDVLNRRERAQGFEPKYCPEP